MDFKTAMWRVTRQLPCAHENNQPRGLGNYVGCDDCGAHVEKARLPHYKKTADEYEEALTYLANLKTESEPAPPAPATGPVEEIPVVLEFRYGGERAVVLSLTQEEWGLPVPVENQLVCLDDRGYIVSQVQLVYISNPPYPAPRVRRIVLLLK